MQMLWEKDWELGGRHNKWALEGDYEVSSDHANAHIFTWELSWAPAWSKHRRFCSEDKFPFCPSCPFPYSLGEVQARTTEWNNCDGTPDINQNCPRTTRPQSHPMWALVFGRTASWRLQWVRNGVPETVQFQVSAHPFWVCDPGWVMSPCAHKELSDVWCMEMLSGCLAFCCSCYTSSQTQLFHGRFCSVRVYLGEDSWLGRPHMPHVPCRKSP